MDKEDKKSAYLYCKFRDEQFALYDEYAKRHGMLMKTLLIVNVLFYAKDGMTQTGRAYYGKVVRHITWAEEMIRKWILTAIVSHK